MAAISATLLQLCATGDEIVAGRTIYGGTYALLKNFLPRLGVATRFVDIGDLDAVRGAVTPRTRVLYAETISNPLLEVADVRGLARIAAEHGLTLVVDNTFSPLVMSPLRLGADVVVHSMTKFINGMSDCVAGCVVSSEGFIQKLNDVNSGACMLLGPALDSTRAAGVLKNLHTLHVRMQRHSANALVIAERFAEQGFDVHYPGLARHPQHTLIRETMNPGFGFGGMVSVDVGDKATADALMVKMQERRVGYLAVSLGYFKTLFSAPGHSTSSEIPEGERRRIGLSDGLIRFSIGLDSDIERTWTTIRGCLEEVGATPVAAAR
jgi:methionine-gamma-lyase